MGESAENFLTGQEENDPEVCNVHHPIHSLFNSTYLAHSFASIFNPSSKKSMKYIYIYIYIYMYIVIWFLAAISTLSNQHQ